MVHLEMPESPSQQPVLVERWLVPTGQYVAWDLPILQLFDGGQSFNLVCNMPVVVHEVFAAPGDLVESGKRIALVEAEGDEIPYGRPNARIETCS